MSKKKWLIAGLLALLCSPKVYAQPATAQRRTMGIEELFRLADENSRSIQTYRTGTEAAREGVRAAKAQRLPDIEASISFSYLGNGRLWDRDFQNGQNIPMPHFGNNFALQASQVLYAGGAISSGIAVAELGEQMAELDYRKNQQEIRFLLTGHYLNLYKLNNQAQVFAQNIELTRRVLKQMEARRSQGTVLKNDITRYELQLENLKLRLAQVQDACRILNHQLVTTLQLPADTEIIPDTTLLAREVLPQAEADWQQLATQMHIGLRQSDVAMQMNRQKVKLERSAQLPKVAIVAEEHLDGPITIEVPTLDNNFNYWFVGVGVKYNFSSLFKNNRKIRQAKLEVRRSQEALALAQEQIENAVQASYVNFRTAFTELNTCLKSAELAELNYRTTSHRYANDLALLTDMLDASNSKLDADLALANARINVVYHFYQMKYITHTL